MGTTYNSVGVSRKDGTLKIRMGNELELRKFMLTREGHTDIQFISLGFQAQKTAAIQLAMGSTSIQEDGSLAPTFGAEAQALFTKYLQDQGVIEKPKKERVKRVKATPAADADAGAETPAAEGVAQDAPVADTVAETQAEAPVLAAAPTLTLDDMPKRDAKGRLYSGATRQQMLDEALAALENKEVVTE